MKFDEITKLGVSRLERVRVRSALNPIIWLSGAIPTIAWIAAYFFVGQPAIAWTLISVGCLPIVAAVLAYMILLFRSPDRLQSEEYQLRQKALQMLFRKGVNVEIVDIANQVVRMESSTSRTDEGGKT